MSYRIDYTNKKVCPVVLVFVRYKDKILLLKRSDKVGTYRGKWNTVGGYLDDERSVIEKAKSELKEELGLSESDIRLIKIGKTHKVADQSINKVWIVHPVLFETRTNKIKLDWEHAEYRWISSFELKKYNTTPQLNESLRRVLI